MTPTRKDKRMSKETPDKLIHTPLGFKWGDVEVKCVTEYDGHKIVSISTKSYQQHHRIKDGHIHLQSVDMFLNRSKDTQ
jgi:hypothetical protein